MDPAWLRAQYGVCALPVCGARIVVVHGAAAAHMRCKAPELREVVRVHLTRELERRNY